ncbi:hypothetical protein [Ralstonia sp. Ralssp110]|uniref:hypothetical protein n=1 Tax=Ralstonia sp. Ralssp110 TaxID=3243004 RepID=UPI0039B56F76
MKLPKLDDLVDEQLAVYEHAANEHLFVAGPPGSGKTSLAVLRARYLRELDVRPVLVTRNKMLATLAGQLHGEGLVTQTMNSFVTGTYRDRFQCVTPQIQPYLYDWDAIIDSFAKAKAEPELGHLVIDEGQNLPAGFFRWAVRFGARTVTVFADEDQTTDPLRASLQDIVSAGMPAPIRLKTNHRNTAEIAEVAEHFHRSSVLPPGVVQRGRGGETPRLVQCRSWADLAALVAARFRNRAQAIGVIVYRRDDVSQLQSMLVEALPTGTRVDAYRGDHSATVGGIRLLDKGITVLSSESAIGLEFDTVYLQDLSRSLPCRSVEDFRRMYMLCARARDGLILIDGPDALNIEQIGDLPDPNKLAR